MNRSNVARAAGVIAGLLLPQLAVGGTLRLAPSSAAVFEPVQYDAQGSAGQPGRGPDHRGSVAQRTRYEGFEIEALQGEIGADVAEEIAVARHQIDIVESVGLKPSDLALFQTMSIEVTAGFAGSHYSGGSSVTIANLLSGDNRPVLLHEFMHVYNAKRMANGFRNADIRHFYDEAGQGGLYQARSYMMTNPAEFFAVTASCYLYGTVAREPYDRETIQRQQPAYYAFLERLFEPPGATHRATKGADATPYDPVPAPRRGRLQPPAARDGA